MRTSAFAAAAILVLTHVMVLLFQYGTATASVWGDWIDTIAPLAAAVISWMVSQQAGPFGRRVWRLVAFSACLPHWAGTLTPTTTIICTLLGHDLAQ